MRPRLVLLLLLAAWLAAGCGAGALDTADQRAPDSLEAPADAGEAQTGLPDSDVDPASGLPWVLEAELPPNAQDTLVLIDDGGPFPYDKDGSTFQNREGILPGEPTGYYAEYTVDKPGEDDRGPWRLVTGDGDEVYWTEDHYSSFSRVWR